MKKHHMPANSVSPLSPYLGSGIQMDPTDHMKTASYKRGKGPDAWRAKQKKLIDEGKFNEAFEMDVQDIQDKFPDGKYDKAIEQAREYYIGIGKIEK